ncbi:MAG: twin-arginine translocase subunit TatB [Gammaproteobacteria bacterium]|nr:twin-arginine translocase subunit TatB [Gammaproteobacteria bacterium]
MFELAFSEMLLVLIIALVVIGPERLPEVARGLGSMVGKVKRFIENVRNETSLQDELADLRRQLDLSREAAQLQQLGESLKSDIQSSVNEIDYSFYNRPSSDEIRRQHNEANQVNATAHLNVAAESKEADELANIQRPTFGRELYEELPPWYHQHSDGAMTPKVPSAPELPLSADQASVSETIPSTTAKTS